MMSLKRVSGRVPFLSLSVSLNLAFIASILTINARVTGSSYSSVTINDLVICELGLMIIEG